MVSQLESMTFFNHLIHFNTQACERKVQAKQVSLEIWLRVGKNIIQLSSYIFTASKVLKLKKFL